MFDIDLPALFHISFSSGFVTPVVMGRSSLVSPVGGTLPMFDGVRQLSAAREWDRDFDFDREHDFLGLSAPASFESSGFSVSWWFSLPLSSLKRRFLSLVLLLYAYLSLRSVINILIFPIINYKELV